MRVGKGVWSVLSNFATGSLIFLFFLEKLPQVLVKRFQERLVAVRLDNLHVAHREVLEMRLSPHAVEVDLFSPILSAVAAAKGTPKICADHRTQWCIRQIAVRGRERYMTLFVHAELLSAFARVISCYEPLLRTCARARRVIDGPTTTPLLSGGGLQLLYV